MASKKTAAKKSAADKPANKADTAVKPMSTDDVDEQPQTYRVDRGESIPGPEPKDAKDAKGK